MSTAKGLFVALEGNVRIIKFNRPEKKNALSPDIYKAITDILNQDAQDDAVVLTILTGTGDYYSSGNDIMESTTLTQGTEQAWIIFRNFIEAFIRYPKLLIAVVNGPAIGLAVTALPLCDVVYASDKATFHTPFVKLGLCAEACSSYTFPLIMGRSKASELLLLGEKLTAKEAYDAKLVSRIVEHSKIEDFIDGLKKKYGNLSVNSIRVTKRLMNEHSSKLLCECNRREVEALDQCVQSEEFSNMLIAFVNRKKSKL